MVNVLELAFVVFLFYIVYSTISKNRDKEREQRVQNKTSYEILKKIYEDCKGPYDDVLIDEITFNRMKEIYGNKKVKI